MSNYPPGVTGNEPEIAGYPEHEGVRKCDAEPGEILTISEESRHRLQRMLEDQGPSHAIGTLDLIQILHSIYPVDLPVCWFEDEVTVTLDQFGYEHWTCPVCRTDHMKDLG